MSNITIKFYNTLSKKLEEFIPLNPKEITIYCCGPTVYDSIHIGNSRPIIVFDGLACFLRNFFRKTIYNIEDIKIKYLRNITDIDEKIINKVKLLRNNYDDFINNQINDLNNTLRYIQSYSPETCRVTHHIDDIIQNIEKIIKNDNGYVTSLGNVYFRVNKFVDYKILAGNNRKDIESISVVNEKDKEYWGDFALWKSVKNDELSWDSPWGRGVPGWHIECSAMINKHLGDKIDIHCGGQDLIFPHHDNEIAQCWGITGEIFCKYWLHNGMVLVDKKKMSKSLGNFIQVKDIVKNKEEGDILKYLILSTHYRQPLNFSKEKWEDAINNVTKIKRFLDKNKSIFKKEQYENFLNTHDNQSIQDLCNDFNTVLCLFNLHKKIKEFNSINKNPNDNTIVYTNLQINLYYTIIFMISSMGMDYFSFL